MGMGQGRAKLLRLPTDSKQPHQRYYKASKLQVVQGHFKTLLLMAIVHVLYTTRAHTHTQHCTARMQLDTSRLHTWMITTKMLAASQCNLKHPTFQPLMRSVNRRHFTSTNHTFKNTFRITSMMTITFFQG